MNLPGGEEIIVTDTVGFIQHLPHQLVAAFRSTLEEAAEADLILQVIDASHPDYQIHMEVVDEVLTELGAESIPRLTVFNKMDRVEERPISAVSGKVLYLSAYVEEDMQRLLQAIEAHIESQYNRYVLRLPTERGDLYALVRRNLHVLREKIGEDGMYYELEVKGKGIEQLSPELVTFLS
ncbi:GTPase HflX [compost metagenome]